MVDLVIESVMPNFSESVFVVVLVIESVIPRLSESSLVAEALV